MSHTHEKGQPDTAARTTPLAASRRAAAGRAGPGKPPGTAHRCGPGEG